MKVYKVSKKFKDGVMDANIYGKEFELGYTIDESNPLSIRLDNTNAKKNENKDWDPGKAYVITKDGEEKTFWFYIKLKSNFNYDIDISQDEKGWIIKEKCCLLSCAPILVSRLPRKLNIWPVRLILLPFELAWMGIKFPVTFVKYAVKVISYNLYLTHPEHVNITVGSEEG